MKQLSTPMTEPFPEENNFSLAKRMLEKILREQEKLPSFISPLRRQEILEHLKEDWETWHAYRKKTKACPPKKRIALSRPLWITKATTSPTRFLFTQEEQKAYMEKIASLKEHNLYFEELESENNQKMILVFGDRLVIAFHKKPCEHLNNDGGCWFCNLSAINAGIVTISETDQIQSITTGLENLDTSITVVEFLPDGSFINDNEISPNVQKETMKIVHEKKLIQRVAIETQPQYCTPDKIAFLLDFLRKDQILEIYFGLETIDPWVNRVINNKGYCWDEFEKTIIRLRKELPQAYFNRLHISAYNFMKPAYLTNHEALEASLRLLQKINAFSKICGIPMEVKCEPSVISEGTIQAFLHQDTTPKNRKYEVLSYFVVAEYLAKAIEQNLHYCLKFGQCDDIDEFSEIAMIPRHDHKEVFAPINIVVYHAVQQFNASKNPRSFLVLMSLALLTLEFKQWEKDFYGKTETSSLYKLVNKEFAKKPLTKKECAIIDTQHYLWSILSNIEYNASICSTLAKISSHKKVVEYIKSEIHKRFSQNKIEVVAINNAKIITSSIPGTRKKRKSVQVEIIVKGENIPRQNLWRKIPFTYLGKPPSLCESGN